jgi:SpoIID/LytB domain protein
MGKPRGRATLAGLVALGAALAVGSTASSADAAVTLSPTGSAKVTYSGNGHGHGLTQYGAQGAAIAGLSYSKILAFYYPGTTLTTITPPRGIRVLLSGTGSTVTIAAYSDTVVTGVSGTLPTTGIARYRLVADPGSKLTLQKLPSATGAKWTIVKTGLPNGAEFYRTNAWSMRLYRSDGTSTRYYGHLRAYRRAATGSSAGVRTVNYVSYRSYTAGVVPREMPASWRRAATDAQAVAVRTYADYEVRNSTNSQYDICDTSACQVYGGHAHYRADGTVAWTDFWQANNDTNNKVLRYEGAPVFSQYSASDGGWTVAGGQPYLPAKADGYDNAKSGDPYLNATKTVKVATLAKYFGLAKATKISITKRDGHGSWGGRVLAGSISGTTSSGAARTVNFAGYQLQDALGLGTTLLTIAAA